MGISTAIVATIAVVVGGGLRTRLGLGAALACGLAAAMLTASAAGLVLLDLEALARQRLAGVLAGAAVAWALVVWRLRARWPVRSRVAGGDRATEWLGGVALVLVLGVGAGLRQDPSPYLHGGQDQGIYVNVGHHIARTGRLRAVDPIMAGRVRGIDPAQVYEAHRMKPVDEGSPLDGVREGRWIAGLHVEDASEGRVIPGFFHLLPTWFAMTELELGFARSTWALVLFAVLSQLGAFAVGFALTAGGGLDPAARRRGWAVGLVAAGALAVHPLDLWVSTFPVSENLARAALLGAAALALAAGTRERSGQPGARMLAALAGATFAAGVFARGSMLALAIVLVGALVLVRAEAPRTRRVLLWTLVVGTTLAAAQAIVHSWPYFFSAASNHFHVPRLQPYKDEAVAWAVVAAVVVLVGDGLVSHARRRWPSLSRTDGVVKGLVVLAWSLAVAAAIHRATDGADDYGPHQHAASVLWRYGGGVGLILGLGAACLAPWRAGPTRQPWVVVGAAILLLTALKEGIRYEFYYARYLVGDAIPVLVIAAAWGLGAAMQRVGARWGPRVASGVWALAIVAWWIPPLGVLGRPVFWVRDLEHGPEDLAAIFDAVPDDAVLFFDAREPGRWRGILATPAFLAFGKTVLVYPHARMIERAVGSGTPLYMLSGGWEPEDHQRWPDRGPWHTTVVARGYYRAQRAEIVEGAVPNARVEWGGPWELHRIDPSIWRGHGAFSLLPGSRFIAPARAGELRTVPIELRWEWGARVELHVATQAARGCTYHATLEGERTWALARVSEPGAPVIAFAMPEPMPAPTITGPMVTAAIAVRWICEGSAEEPSTLPWRRLSMRWERK